MDNYIYYILYKLFIINFEGSKLMIFFYIENNQNYFIQNSQNLSCKLYLKIKKIYKTKLKIIKILG